MLNSTFAGFNFCWTQLFAGCILMTAITSAVHGAVFHDSHRFSSTWNSLCVCVCCVRVCFFLCVCVCFWCVCVCVFFYSCSCVCVASKTAEGGWGKKMFAVKCVWCNSVKLLLFNFSWIQLSWIQLCLDFPGFSFAVSGCF